MVFDPMDPVVAFISGAVLGLIASGVVLRMSRHRNPPHGHRHETMLALYETQPDGVFSWRRDTVPGGQSSTALCDMLHLPTDRDVSFEDVAGVFASSESALLTRAAQGLRQAGTGFEMLLPIGDRMIHAIGRQAGCRAGRQERRGVSEPVGEIIWFRDVTALVCNVDMSDAEQQMRTVFDAMPIPVWLRDPDLELAFTNERAGEDGNAVAGRAVEIASRAIREGGTRTERRMLDVDGNRRVLEITESPLGPGAGTVGYAVEHMGDGHSDLAMAVQYQRAQFEQMLETLGAGIVTYESDKRVVFYNAAFAALWQMDEGWLDDRPSLSQVLDAMRDSRLLPEVPDFRAYRDSENAQFGALERPDERTMHLPDGRTLRATVTPVRNGGLNYIYEDITDRLDLQRSYKTLDMVQRHTIDNLQESVAVFGGDGRLKLCNAPFLSLWQLDEDTAQSELHMSEVIERMRDSGEDDESWARRRRKILAHFTGRQAHNGRFRRRTGSVYDIACVPLPDGATLVSYLDVTDRAAVESALRQRAEMLAETDRLKSKFIDDVSYEIRTPMTTIGGFAEILNEGYFGDLNGRQREYVQGIHATAKSMMTVIADILELAAVESGTVQLEKDAIDIHAMLASAMKLITERARQKEIHMTFDVPTDIGWLSADARRLKQVVFNLLANAVRFTPRRGGVRLGAARSEDGVEITVADTGVGIPRADIERVFHKFSKGSQPAGEPEGAGLGLAMVKSFVELHGGSVTIKSPSNRGTIVTCYLPATGTEGGDARDAFRHDSERDAEQDMVAGT